MADFGNWLLLFELVGTIIIGPLLSYAIYVLKDNRKEQKEARKNADVRDKKIEEILINQDNSLRLIDELKEELQEIKEINEQQSLVIDKHSEELEKLDHALKVMGEVVETLGDAEKQNLSYLISRLCNQYLLTEYIHTEQLKDLESKFLVYKALRGNGTIEKLYKSCLELPIRDDLPVVNVHIEEYKQAMARLNLEPEGNKSKTRKQPASRKPRSKKTETTQE